MVNTGFIDSGNDERDLIFNKPQLYYPTSFIYGNVGKLYNQGSSPICVPCAIASSIANQFFTINKEVQIDVNDLFNSRADKKMQGMIPREAFDILLKKGVKSNAGVIKILNYYRIKDIADIKRALFVNGCVFIALPYCSEGVEFWKGGKAVGGHAVCLMGYNDNIKKFKLKNSWGYSYNNSGLAEISYADIEKCMLEAWTFNTKLV